MLSIIIPTFNEEKFLPSLLDSIKKQYIEEYEIIIADNDSNDKTREIAKKYDCKVIKGGKPAKAKNNGAKKAKYNNLLFLDSDVVLPEGFMKKFLDKIIYQKLDFATCRISPLTKKSKQVFYYMLKNYGNFIFSGHVSGQCLFVKKALFTKVKGFDEAIFMAEEHELAERLYKNGKGKFFMDVFIHSYPRRLEKEGTYRTLIKDIYSELYRMFKGNIKHELYKKKYGHY